MEYLEIRKFAYLKTPKVSWTLFNADGGSFSNSGMLPSVKKAVQHFLRQNWRDPVTFPVKVVSVVGFRENDEPIEEVHDCVIRDIA